MKVITHIAVAATCVAGVAAQPHPQHLHQHRHLHAKRHQHSHLEKREPEVYTKYVEGPTVKVYELAGQEIESDKAQDGIDKGLYIVVGETKPTFTPPPAPEPTTRATATTSSAKKDAQFFEQKVASSVATSEKSAATSATSSSSSGGYSNGGGGVDTPFPDGELDCSEFPSDYGAVPAPWLGKGGWVGIQKVPTFKMGFTASINDFDIADVPIGGGGPVKNSFASYACPPGYEKSQWPEAQGSQGASVGGILCNSQGKLELTRTTHKTLCQPGAGGVKVQNKLPETAAICRTNYPGDEGMTIALETEPGQTYTLTNPTVATSYVWKGTSGTEEMETSAQYYVNPLGVSVNESCLWDSPNYPDSAGNYAPINIGTHQDKNGVSWLSIFRNLPSSHAILDFDIEIIGAGSECALRGNTFYGGTDSGCTASIQKGQTATFVFKASS